eukprot:3439049-Amphidinium_carterae.1
MNRTQLGTQSPDSQDQLRDERAVAHTRTGPSAYTCANLSTRQGSTDCSPSREISRTSTIDLRCIATLSSMPLRHDPSDCSDFRNNRQLTRTLTGPTLQDSQGQLQDERAAAHTSTDFVKCQLYRVLKEPRPQAGTRPLHHSQDLKFASPTGASVARAAWSL